MAVEMKADRKPMHSGTASAHFYFTMMSFLSRRNRCASSVYCYFPMSLLRQRIAKVKIYDLPVESSPLSGRRSATLKVHSLDYAA